MVAKNGDVLLCPTCGKTFYPGTVEEDRVFYTYCTACKHIISSFLVHPIETNSIVKKISRKLGFEPD
jgi:hypothetical protein